MSKRTQTILGVVLIAPLLVWSLMAEMTLTRLILVMLAVMLAVMLEHHRCEGDMKIFVTRTAVLRELARRANELDEIFETEKRLQRELIHDSTERDEQLEQAKAKSRKYK